MFILSRIHTNLTISINTISDITPSLIIIIIIIINFTSLGTGGDSQKAQPVQGANP